MAKVYGFDDSQYARLAAMLHAFESGTLWPSDKPLNPPITADPAKVRYHNDSGEAIPRFAVMRVTGVNSAGAAPWRVKVGKPNTTFYSVYLVNSGVRCPISGNGWGTYLFNSGHVLCDSTYVPTIGEEWGPTDAQWHLVRYRPGFIIDGGPTGSGATYRAVAKQRVVTSLVGKADGAAVVDTGTFTMSIWMRAKATGTMEDTTMNLTTVLAWGAAITSGKKVSALLHGGQWMGAPWEC